MTRGYYKQLKLEFNNNLDFSLGRGWHSVCEDWGLIRFELWKPAERPQSINGQIFAHWYWLRCWDSAPSSFLGFDEVSAAFSRD